MNLIVQKFGGSSLATPELREVAAARVAEAVERGDRPVVVCSALGRTPDPYATDVLATLLGPAPSGPNRDLLLACGEAIASAVFAEMLCARGVPAQAMTGRQAGILTDDQYGKAEIQSVDPEPLLKLIARGIVLANLEQRVREVLADGRAVRHQRDRLLEAGNGLVVVLVAQPLISAFQGLVSRIRGLGR